MGIRDRARARITKGAKRAHERGDSVYVHTMGNVGGAARAGTISLIEGVGWRLEDQRQVVGTGLRQGRPVWSLTFRRAA